MEMGAPYFETTYIYTHFFYVKKSVKNFNERKRIVFFIFMPFFFFFFFKYLMSSEDFTCTWST